jgi:uncharacterized membrane-anchored protein YhcB (DUF1043 family)
MSLNNLYALLGLVTGTMLGFLTRDDYLNNSFKKITMLKKDYDESVHEVNTMIADEKKRNKELEESVNRLRDQLNTEKMFT